MALAAGKGGSRKTERWLSPPGLPALGGRNIHDSSDILKKVIALPEKYKSTVILYYYDDYSVDEISKILKISKSAVKMRLKRGREILKLELEDYV